MPPTVPEDTKEADQASSDGLPEVPPEVKIPSSVPVTQAAQNLVDAAQRQQEILDKQKAKCGIRSMRWAGRNAQNFQLPFFAKQIGAGQDDRSV